MLLAGFFLLSPGLWLFGGHDCFAQEPTAREAPANQAFDEESPRTPPPTFLTDRLYRFRVPAILLAGLVDGLNPCAFAAIIFLITLLAATNVRRRKIMALGLGYSLAAFFTYLALGFGIFRALQATVVWPWLGDALRWGMQPVLLLLAALSFRDALMYRRHGRADSVVLQLPDRFKRKTRSLMRKRIHSANLFAGGLALGAAVTLIDAVCTGQLYWPTLILLSRYAETRGRAVPLLILYNAMFIAPLLAITAAACLGTSNKRLVEWSRNNVPVVKGAMGTFFILLAVLLWVGVRA